MVLMTVGFIGIPALLLYLEPMDRQVMSIVAIGFVLLFATFVANMPGARVIDVVVGTAT